VQITRTVGLPESEKNCLNKIPACDGRSDRRTDILPRDGPCYAYASRGETRIDIVETRSWIFLFRWFPGGDCSATFVGAVVREIVSLSRRLSSAGDC